MATRREVSSLTLGGLALLATPVQRKAQSGMSDNVYETDLDDLATAFPPDREMPALLADFANWLQRRTWGNVGYFSLTPGRAEIAPIVDGSPLWDQFALFLRLPEGSVGGFWYGEGVDPADPPVVILGSEGQATLFAPSLAGFIARLALGGDYLGGWSDLEPMEKDQRPELAQWLADVAGRDAVELAEFGPDQPDYVTFIENWSVEREAYWGKHKLMAEVASLLAAHAPPPEPVWGRTIFTVAMLGDAAQIEVLRAGPQPVPEADAVLPILARIRRQQAERTPGVGLWTAGYLALGANGRIVPSFDFFVVPAFDNLPALFAQDQALAPRPPQRIPDWAR